MIFFFHPLPLLAALVRAAPSPAALFSNSGAPDWQANKMSFARFLSFLFFRQRAMRTRDAAF